MNKIIQLYEKIPSDTPLFIINNNNDDQLSFLLTETADYEIFEKNKKFFQPKNNFDVDVDDKKKEKENVLKILLFITLWETDKNFSCGEDYSTLFEASANSFVTLSFQTIKKIFHGSIFPKIITKQSLRKSGKLSSTCFTSDKKEELYYFIITAVEFIFERQDGIVLENDIANNQCFVWLRKITQLYSPPPR
jgi:hypothetical protein